MNDPGWCAKTDVAGEVSRFARAIASAASFVVSGCVACQLQLASLAQADGFRQLCSDVGRISHDPSRNMLLVCNAQTHTWFMLPMMPQVAHHDAGTACSSNNSEALSQDNSYLLTCINGLWVNGN
ncbi:MAG: hypothetical protein WAN71_03150 [Mycobacterium sp.]|uniref:hypothetical protein n=1 Tax=Mycobacterium sp. TaxID=1785 RepID=UPI003BB0C611